MESRNKQRKFDIFMNDFNNKIGIYINDKLNNGEVKVVLKEDYINTTLNINYRTDNLYSKLRNILIETGNNISVSIKRKSKEFVFFRSSKDVKRETDLIKPEFEKKLMEYVTTYPTNLYTKNIKENLLKKYLGISHSSEYLHKKLNNILSDKGIDVYFENGEFIFCNEERRLEIERTEYESKIENDLKEKERMRELEEKIKKENLEIINKVYTNNEKTDEINENSEFKNDEVLCPKCREKVEYLEKPCKKCGFDIVWEEVK
jgi:hypothetical protein